MRINLLLVIFVWVLISGCSASAKNLKVMSLNIYGWQTMPKHSQDFANLIQWENVDILGIQEGVDDWQLESKFPTDYQRSIWLNQSLGDCWQRRFQIFVNQCKGNELIEEGRFDLTDGPNATRTGEYAVVKNGGIQYLIVNVHWDHESTHTQRLNATETSNFIDQMQSYPTILLGDFNARCDGKIVSQILEVTTMKLLHSGGIDCIFVRGLEGVAYQLSGYPSDHPAVVAVLNVNGAENR